jgi:hypothetical protein
MSAWSGKGLILIRVVELSHFDGAFVETVKQAGIDSHLAEILPQRLPMGPAAAGWTVMNADHSITPDIGRRLA